MKEILNQLLKESRVIDAFRIIRYQYRIGDPILSDAAYDAFEQKMHILFPDCQYLKQTYDDDEIPVDLIQEFKLATPTMIDPAKLDKLAELLNEDKSLSIESVTCASDSFEYFQMLKQKRLDFMASVKVDGVNTKMLYVTGELKLSLSRGRGDATSLDYMTGSSKIMPLLVPEMKFYENLKTVGESYVDKDSLEYFREKYNNKRYKTSKSSAISLLRTEHDTADYSHLHTLIFAAEGIDTTLSGMFQKLEKWGFETVPHVLHKWEEIPDNIEEFEQWLKEDVMQPIAKAGENLPSDGCVIEVNDLMWVGDQHAQYSNRQLALKFGPWAFKLYKGVIRDIVMTQRRVYQSFRVLIEPMITEDDCKAEVINIFNASIMIENDLFIGKEVYFEKNAGAVNILVHGKRLDLMLEEQQNE